MATAPSIRDTIHHTNQSLSARFHQYQLDNLLEFRLVSLASLAAYGLAMLLLLGIWIGPTDNLARVMSLNVRQLERTNTWAPANTFTVSISFQEAKVVYSFSSGHESRLSPELFFPKDQEDRIIQLDFTHGNTMVIRLLFWCFVGGLTHVGYVLRSNWFPYRGIFTTAMLAYTLLLLSMAHEGFELVKEDQKNGAMWVSQLYGDSRFNTLYATTWNTADVRRAVDAAKWEWGSAFAMLLIVILCQVFVLCMDMYALVIFKSGEWCFPTNVHRFERIPSHGEEDNNEMVAVEVQSGNNNNINTIISGGGDGWGEEEQQIHPEVEQLRTGM